VEFGRLHRCLTAIAVQFLGLYAGTYSNGVFHSADAAGTWAPTGGIGNAQVPQVAIDPINPLTVYAAANLFGDAFVTKLYPNGTSPLFHVPRGRGMTAAMALPPTRLEMPSSLELRSP
jgi:hypothetical protein